jgi:hypothetical protein
MESEKLQKSLNTYSAIKSKHQTAYDKILSDCQVFWAFNQDQLREGMEKNGITKDNKMCSIGMGGYMPVKNNKKMAELLKEEDKRFKEELQELRKQEEGAILYELNNHECFYTGDFQVVIDTFKGVFTPAKIKKVFNKHQAQNVLGW